jgi:hypothetical protein
MLLNFSDAEIFSIMINKQNVQGWTNVGLGWGSFENKKYVYISSKKNN